MASVELLQRDERELSELAGLLATTPAAVADGVRRKLDEIKALQDEIRALRATAAAGRAAELAAGRRGRPGRRPRRRPRAGRPPRPRHRRARAARRQRRRARRAQRHRRGVAGGRAATALGRPGRRSAPDAAKAVKGGGGGKGDVAVAGGKDPSGVDEALRIAGDAARSRRSRRRLTAPCGCSGSTSARSASGSPSSDRSGTIASPLTVLPASGKAGTDHARIAALVAEEEAERRGRRPAAVPRRLARPGGPGCPRRDGGAGQRWCAVPVETFDERLTTVTADRALMEANMRAEARRRVVDKVAAAVMLQTWLDRRAAR